MIDILPSLIALERDVGECCVDITIKDNILRVQAYKGQIAKHVDIDVTKSLYQTGRKYASFGDILEMIAQNLNFNPTGGGAK